MTVNIFLLLPLALRPAVGFGLSNNTSSFFPIYPQLCPSSHFQHLEISFYYFSPSFPGSSSSSRPFQFLSEDLFGHPILLYLLILLCVLIIINVLIYWKTIVMKCICNILLVIDHPTGNIERVYITIICSPAHFQFYNLPCSFNCIIQIYYLSIIVLSFSLLNP